MRERIHAPELAGATAWLNVERPPALRDLRGQIVILDFWTYCCINCMHVLPILRDLEERHREDPLVVIGVHSAKFDAEKDAQHIQQAMRRYGVGHAVAVDSEMRLWSQYAVRSWPTLVVIRPDGTLAAVAPGEPDPQVLEAFVQELLAQARADGTLADRPVRLEAREQREERALSHPGKVAASQGRIAVADSGHHRVLVLGMGGAVQETIGSGLRGPREGPFAEAALDDPQGLVFDGDALYIADARAHAVFRADLRSRTLRRLAGTGQLGRAPISQRTRALETALRSPWDLALRGNELFVALAGSHQLGVIDLREGTIEAVAGNGREALIDGPGAEAALAQPSGLALSGDELFFADSEDSGVRALDLRTRRVRTLVGGPGLFDFGDKVGAIEEGMLQHPLAVAATPAGLVVADTYNDKLKRFSKDERRLEPFSGGTLQFAQPAGLAVLPSGGILVADTNHHRLVQLSEDGARAAELPISGAPVPRVGVVVAESSAGAPAAAGAAGWFTAILQAREGVGFAPGAGKLLLQVTAPERFELSRGAPWTAALEVSRRSDLLHVRPELARGESAGGRSEIIEIAVEARHAQDVDSELLVELRTVVCDAADHAACHPVRNSFRVPLHLLTDGQREVRVAVPLEPATVRPEG
jgi:thiol-disulfide isomerase/thioredoxin/sugar lactone lactonase YvrE